MRCESKSCRLTHRTWTATARATLSESPVSMSTRTPSPLSWATTADDSGRGGSRSPSSPRNARGAVPTDSSLAPSGSGAEQATPSARQPCAARLPVAASSHGRLGLAPIHSSATVSGAPLMQRMTEPSGNSARSAAPSPCHTTTASVRRVSGSNGVNTRVTQPRLDPPPQGPATARRIAPSMASMSAADEARAAARRRDAILSGAGIAAAPAPAVGLMLGGTWEGTAPRRMVGGAGRGAAPRAAQHEQERRAAAVRIASERDGAGLDVVCTDAVSGVCGSAGSSTSAPVCSASLPPPLWGHGKETT